MFPHMLQLDHTYICLNYFRLPPRGRVSFSTCEAQKVGFCEHYIRQWSLFPLRLQKVNPPRVVGEGSDDTTIEKVANKHNY